MIDLPIDSLLDWYQNNKRDLPWRRTSDPYAIWVAEVMLQQTQVNTVIPYYQRFLTLFPTIGHLAKAGEQQVLKVWEGLGYYTRARNLHRAADRVKNEFQGEIPLMRREFRALPGVGPYICAAVLSISAGLSVPVVDGNVLRVYSRFRAIMEEVDKSSTRGMIYRDLEKIIPVSKPGDFNQAMMELGAMVCAPKNPDCRHCPLKDACEAKNRGLIEQLPRRSAKKKIPEYQVSVAVIVSGDKIFIQRRPSTGHLGGLWEFPGGKQQGQESALETLMRECLEELDVHLEVIKKLTMVKHAYTHFKIKLHPFICHVNKGEKLCCHNATRRWITLEQLDQYPFPQANHKIFPELHQFFPHSK